MTATCPCCGQAVPPNDLLVDLNTNTVSRFGTTVSLTPQVAEIAFTIWQGHPGTTRIAALYAAVYGQTDGPDTMFANIRVRISHLRRAVARLGVAVIAVQSIGYRLELTDAPFAYDPALYRSFRRVA